MKAAPGLLLVLLPLHLVLAAPRPPPGPVAVMPFRNLNADAAQNWLARGMAETLVSDLRSSGNMVLVEREQLDAAIAELKLQTEAVTTESSAVRVGRLVGARTIVIGSLQRAGDTLRINARFIDVETGTVLDSAKVTGRADRVFALQDEMAAKLLGSPVKPRAKRPSGPQAVRTLETYGRALETKSQEERAALLRATLEEAPAFDYARDELARMEARLAELAQKATSHWAALESSLRATMQDPALPLEERSAAALRLLDINYPRARWRTLLQDANRILSLELPVYQGRLPAEQAAYARFVALDGLRDWDAALEAGDTFLRTYPHAESALAIDGAMRGLTLRLAEDRRRLKQAHDYIAQLEQETAVKVVILEHQGLPTTEALRLLDEARCDSFAFPQQFEHALRPCRAYYEKWGPGTQFVEKHAAREARDAEIVALIALRRFAEARERLAAFRSADPEGERDSAARSAVLGIRRDEED
ncbi:FlgO family outer membrane protein [Myxococcus stipitatus]|uniref:FlgO family outer membrane protein n=1 Tax=Myxococcus stipitatus TaxID=83455 RepID=UPI0030CB36FB